MLTLSNYLHKDCSNSCVKSCLEWWKSDIGKAAAQSRPDLEERVGTSGGINTWSNFRFCSDPEPFTEGKRNLRLLFILGGLKSGFIFTHVYQPLLLQWPTEVTSIVRCLCSLIFCSQCWLAGGKYTLKKCIHVSLVSFVNLPSSLSE